MKTLVLGIGNTILSDDGVGPRVAQLVRWALGNAGYPAVTVMETAVSGLSLLDLLVGYERAIVIDAVQREGGEVGHVYRLTRKDFGVVSQTPPPHRMDLFTAIGLGESMALPMPREVVIYAIEVADLTTFDERCTPAVEAAIPLAASKVLEELRGA